MYNIIQIGAGGTGGHLIHFLSSYYHRRRDKISNYHILDGDIVEAKNIKRQNFLTQDIGSAKSTVLGVTYNVGSFPYYVDDTNIFDFMDKEQHNVVIGCVDKIPVRLKLDSVFKEKAKEYPIYYIDGGNTRNYAQVLLYDYQNQIGQDITEYFKNITEEQLAVASCTELGDQTIAANMMSASMIINTVINLIERNKITHTKFVINKYTIARE